MKYTYSLEMIDGHVVMTAGNLKYLIDTGAPYSVSGRGPIIFGVKAHSVESNFMGVSCESLSADVGAHIDALVGADILNHYDILIDSSTSAIILSEEPLSIKGQSVTINQYMGIPIIKVAVSGQTIAMFFDTGAKLSYLDPEISRDYPKDGSAEDFYPGIGKFYTDTYQVPIYIGTEEIMLRVGTLPPLLNMSLMQAATSGILGTAILERYTICIAQRRKILVFSKRNEADAMPKPY